MTCYIRLTNIQQLNNVLRFQLLQYTVSSKCSNTQINWCIKNL